MDISTLYMYFSRYCVYRKEYNKLFLHYQICIKFSNNVLKKFLLGICLGYVAIMEPYLMGVLFFQSTLFWFRLMNCKYEMLCRKRPEISSDWKPTRNCVLSLSVSHGLRKVQRRIILCSWLHGVTNSLGVADLTGVVSMRKISPGLNILKY
jgi:hypothetical protein